MSIPKELTEAILERSGSVRRSGEIIHQQRKNQRLAISSINSSGERGSRRESAGLGADVRFRWRADHPSPQRPRAAPHREASEEDRSLWAGLHRLEQAGDGV